MPARGSGRLLRRLLSNKYLLVSLEAVIVIAVIASGIYVRVHPFYTVKDTISFLEARYSDYLRGIDRKLLYYGYLFGNDPWIEYWLTNYLYSHGIGSWSTLTRENPDTHIFWYPWGRDFTSSEYPLIPMVTAFTYTLFKPHMSLQQWSALLPPVAALFMIIAGYLYMRRLYGPFAGITAAVFLSLLPASIDRTHAGFVEKEGIAMPLLVGGLLFFSVALANAWEKKWRAVIYAVVAGVLFGLIGLTWGGYIIPGFIIAATALWLPLALREKEDMKPYVLVAYATALAYSAMLVVAEMYTKVSLLAPLAVALLGPALAFILSTAVFKYSQGLLVKLPRILGSPKRLYFAVLIVIGVAAIIALPYIGVRGRLFYTIAWPLRGFVQFHPLLESVAEHQPVIGSPAFMEINGVLFTGLMGSLLILFYTSLKLGRKEDIPLGILAFGTLYSTLGLSYLLQTAGVMGSLATAALIGVFEANRRARETGGRRRARVKRETSDIVKTVIALVVLLLVSLAAFNAHLAAARMYRVSGYLTSNSPVPNPAWILTLNYLEETNSVVVTWWDYGYWVSVGAGRPSLADGATLNTSQIELLAKMLISDENTSSTLMEEFGLKPNQTLVLVHDIVDVTSDGRAFYQGAIDIPKSFWMVRIAGAHDPRYEVRDYFVPVNLGQRIVPMVSVTAKGAAQALIYRILADAVKHLHDRGIAVTDKEAKVYQSFISLADFVNNKPANTTLVHFEPDKVFAFTIGSYKLPTGEDVTRYLLIAIYKWTG